MACNVESQRSCCRCRRDRERDTLPRRYKRRHRPTFRGEVGMALGHAKQSSSLACVLTAAAGMDVMIGNLVCQKRWQAHCPPIVFVRHLLK